MFVRLPKDWPHAVFVRRVHVLHTHNAHPTPLTFPAPLTFIYTPSTFAFTGPLPGPLPPASPHLPPSFQFTFSTEVVPVCKDDIVCLPDATARAIGNISNVVLVTKGTCYCHFQPCATYTSTCFAHPLTSLTHP